MTDETKPPKLVSSRVPPARARRHAPAAPRGLANPRRPAERGRDWEVVGEVRSTLAQTALGLEELADSYAPREG